MKVQDIVSFLEKTAPPSLQEDYDNCGLITGNREWECTGIVVSLDTTVAVIDDAIQKGCNLIVAHHPIVFKGIKKITGNDYVEQALIRAIKNDIVIYAIHTNLDNMLAGVNGKIADKLNLQNRTILAPKHGQLKKLSVFVPSAHKEQLMNALFTEGAGDIGNYSECSFVIEGQGSFKPGPSSNPFIGKPGVRQLEPEAKVEVIYPAWLQNNLIGAMRAVHPYEEIAYDIYNLLNLNQQIGAGLVGELPESTDAELILHQLQDIFNIPVIKHTALLGKPIKRLAVCGGAGSFLTSVAISSGADMYITSDVKYHEFFDAEGKVLLADIGHYESEQFTIDLLYDLLREKFPNFAVLKTGVNTNPVHYFTRIAQ